MDMRRVAVTGMGSISSFDKGVDILMASLLANQSGVSVIPELAERCVNGSDLSGTLKKNQWKQPSKTISPWAALIHV